MPTKTTQRFCTYCRQRRPHTWDSGEGVSASLLKFFGLWITLGIAGAVGILMVIPLEIKAISLLACFPFTLILAAIITAAGAGGDSIMRYSTCGTVFDQKRLDKFIAWERENATPSDRSGQEPPQGSTR